MQIIIFGKHILPQLMKHGRVVRGYLGLHGRNVPLPTAVARRHGLPAKTGVQVVAVETGAPADQAGLLEDDIIIGLGEQAVTSIDDLHKLLTSLPVEVPAALTFLRGERKLERMVIPREYPHPLNSN